MPPWPERMVGVATSWVRDPNISETYSEVAMSLMRMKSLTWQAETVVSRTALFNRVSVRETAIGVNR